MRSIPALSLLLLRYRRGLCVYRRGLCVCVCVTGQHLGQTALLSVPLLLSVQMYGGGIMCVVFSCVELATNAVNELLWRKRPAGTHTLLLLNRLRPATHLRKCMDARRSAFTVLLTYTFFLPRHTT